MRSTSFFAFASISALGLALVACAAGSTAADGDLGAGTNAATPSIAVPDRGKTGYETPPAKPAPPQPPASTSGSSGASGTSGGASSSSSSGSTSSSSSGGSSGASSSSSGGSSGASSSGGGGAAGACGICDRDWLCGDYIDHWKTVGTTCVNSAVGTKLHCNGKFDQDGYANLGTWSGDASGFTMWFPGDFGGEFPVDCTPAP